MLGSTNYDYRNKSIININLNVNIL
jgi:hypothetical protein